MTTASTNAHAQPRENEAELPMVIEQCDNSDNNKVTKKNKVPPSNDDDFSNEAIASTANPSEPTVTAASTAPALPARPIKRARTAYFIFTDEKRSEIQAQVSSVLFLFEFPVFHQRDLSLSHLFTNSVIDDCIPTTVSWILSCVIRR